MASLDDLALFVGIVDAGSLAAAARRAGLPKSSVSRRLAGLETRLNTRLLQRSTRQLGLTDAGRRLYERCRPLVEEARAAEDDIIAQPTEPHGLLRVTATGAFGRLYVAPLLGEFLARNPLVRAELLLLDRRANLIEEGFDIAIRLGALDDSGLISRKLGDVERVLCASPVYLGRLGGIGRLDELESRDALTMTNGNRWTFQAGDRQISASPTPRLASNEVEVLHAAALAGCGVALLPRFMVLDDLDAGRLVKLLPETPPTPIGVQAIWPGHRNTPARTRGLVDYMAARLAVAETWDRPIQSVYPHQAG